MTVNFGSRRADCKGYLEFIWIEDGTENPQAIAYIADMYPEGRPWYCGMVGTKVFEGSSVAAVKEQLFAHLDQAIGA